MLRLETRQIRLLDILLQQEYTSLEQLISLSHLSQNTVLSEIHEINDILNESLFHIQIVNQRGKGYILEYQQQEQTTIHQLKKHCFFYLNTPQHSVSLNHERIVWLLRYMLAKRHNVKSEELAQKTNVSLATLNKDLRVVRKILKKYHISIISTPYYGMHIEGQELAIRSCFIDYCDLYMVYEENIFPQYFLNQFELDYNDFYHVFNQVREIVIKNNIQLNDNGLKRMSLYILSLPILSARMSQAHIADLNSFSIDCPLTSLLDENNTIEHNLLTLFYLSILESINNQENKLFLNCVPESINLYQQGLNRLEKISGFKIKGSSLETVINKAILKIALREKYGLYNFSTPDYVQYKLRKEIASYSFSVYIINAFYPNAESLYRDTLFYDLIADIYQTVYNLNNEYYDCHALIISHLGTALSNVELVRLKRSIDRVEFSICNEYELDTIDYHKYDFIVVFDTIEINCDAIPIPVYQNNVKDPLMNIWSNHIVKKRKVKVLRPYLDAPVFTTILKGCDILDVIIDVFINKGYDLLMPNSDFKKLLKALICDGLYNQSPDIKIITLLSTQNIEYKYFAFNFEKPIQYNGGEIGLLHFLFMDASYGPIVIKNGDSELCRYFNV